MKRPKFLLTEQPAQVQRIERAIARRCKFYVFDAPKSALLTELGWTEPGTLARGTAIINRNPKAADQLNAWTACLEEIGKARALEEYYNPANCR